MRTPARDSAMSQQKIEALEQEIAQLQDEVRTQAAAEQYLRSQLAQALRAVELAKKQLMLLEMQQLEIQSLRNQLSTLGHQVEFAREREARLEQRLQAAEEALALARRQRAAAESQPTRYGGNPSLPAFLLKPVAAVGGDQPSAD